MTIQAINYFEKVIDWSIFQCANQYVLFNLKKLFPLSFSVEPFKQLGRYFFIGTFPFIGYLSIVYFKTALKVITIAYMFFKTRNNLLYYSAYKEKLTIMKVMVFIGADVNRRSLEGWTSLHYAVNKTNIQAIKFLLNQGADPNIEAYVNSGFDYPETSINWTVSGGSIHTFEIIENHMLKKGISIDYSTLFRIAQDIDNCKSINKDLISKIQNRLQ